MMGDEDEKRVLKTDSASGLLVSYDRGRRRVRNVRAKTMSAERTPKFRLRLITSEADEAERQNGGRAQLPRTRGECEGGPRPCPMVSCSNNLYLDVSPVTGSIKFNFPDLAPEQMPERGSCALDVADLGGVQLEVVGSALNLTRERVRQVEEVALRRIALAIKLRGQAAEFLDALAAAEARGQRGTPLALAVLPGRTGGQFVRGSRVDAEGEEDEEEPEEEERQYMPKLPRISDREITDEQYVDAFYKFWRGVAAERAKRVGIREIRGRVVSWQAQEVYTVVVAAWEYGGRKPTYEEIGMWTAAGDGSGWTSRVAVIAAALKSLRDAGLVESRTLRVTAGTPSK